MAPLLDLRGPGIHFRIEAGEVPATRDVSFAVRAGERFGMVGESGCGKTVTGLSILAFCPPDPAAPHLVPKAIQPAVVQVTLLLAVALLAEAS